MPKAIFWDWDGTIVNSMPHIYKALNEAHLRAGQRGLTSDELRHIVRTGPQPVEIFTDLKHGDVDGSVTFFDRRLKELRSVEIVQMINVETSLKTAFDMGVLNGVVSNMQHDELKHEVEALGWTKYFSAIVGAGKAPRNKPHPDPIFAAADEMGLSREDVKDSWFVGDMEGDKLAAAASGCIFMFYAGANQAEMECHSRITDYSQLTAMLHKLQP